MSIDMSNEPHCRLCFSENVYETENEHYPFACHDCSAYGPTIHDISTPDTSDDDYRCGQVARRPAAA